MTEATRRHHKKRYLDKGLSGSQEDTLWTLKQAKQELLDESRWQHVHQAVNLCIKSKVSTRVGDQEFVLDDIATPSAYSGLKRPPIPWRCGVHIPIRPWNHGLRDAPGDTYGHPDRSRMLLSCHPGKEMALFG